jgi:CBS domain-containing protein
LRESPLNVKPGQRQGPRAAKIVPGMARTMHRARPAPTPVASNRSFEMKVQRIMTRTVQSCSTNDTLAEAAWMMWKFDIGCLPVTGPDGRVTSVITDRDIAMAALFSGRPLQEQHVSRAMSARLATVLEDDDMGTLEDVMRSAQVHRVPVVNAAGSLRGIITLNDLAHHRHGKMSGEGVSPDEVASTLAAVSAPRTPSLVVSAPKAAA